MLNEGWIIMASSKVDGEPVLFNEAEGNFKFQPPNKGFAILLEPLAKSFVKNLKRGYIPFNEEAVEPSTIRAMRAEMVLSA